MYEIPHVAERPEADRQTGGARALPDVDGNSVAYADERTDGRTREGMAYTGEMYLAGQDPHQELAAPAVLADLTGFPPILLQVGTNELLLDDSVRLAEKARDADVDVILDVTAGVPHVLLSLIGQLVEADQALDRAALFLTQHPHA